MPNLSLCKLYSFYMKHRKLFVDMLTFMINCDIMKLKIT